MGVLRVSGVKRHSREKQHSGYVKSECQGLNNIAKRNSPVGVVCGVPECQRLITVASYHIWQ